MDDFYEQLLPAEKKSSYKVVNALVYIFAILASATLIVWVLEYSGFTKLTIKLSESLGFDRLTIWFLIFCLIFVVCAFISFILKKRLFVEYEYELTNGIIDIDVIYEMKSRKKLISFDIKNIELMALESSNYIKDFTNDVDKEEHLYTKTSQNDVYVLIIKREGKLIKILFTPDNKFVELCSKYNSKAVKI